MYRRPARCRARARSPAALPVRCSAGPVPWPPSCGQRWTLPTPSPGQPDRRATASPCRATPWRPGNPAGRQRLLVPAYLRDLLVQVFQVRLHAHPAFERRQAPVQRVEPRESVIRQPGTCPLTQARTRTPPRPSPDTRAATGSPARAPGSGPRPASPAPARPPRRPRGAARAGCARCRCSHGRVAVTRAARAQPSSFSFGVMSERRVPERCSVATSEGLGDQRLGRLAAKPGARRAAAPELPIADIPGPACGPSTWRSCWPCARAAQVPTGTRRYLRR